MKDNKTDSGKELQSDSTSVVGFKQKIINTEPEKTSNIPPLYNKHIYSSKGILPFENIAEIFRGFRKNKKARKKKNISNDHTPQ